MHMYFHVLSISFSTASKRSVADEASKLRDIVLKTKEMANTIK